MYVTIYSAIAFLSAIARGSSKSLLFFTLFLLVLFMGTRYYVGCDFTGYLNRFENTPFRFSLSDVVGSTEPGFELIIRAVRYFELEYYWLNITASALILFGVYKFVNSFQKPLYILALLFPIVILQLGMSGIRQGIAVAFLMASVSDFTAGRRLKTALWIIFASTFHTSAIVFLPMALIAGRKVDATRIIGAAILVFPVIIALGSDRLSTYNERYVEQVYGSVSSSGAWIRYAMTLAPTLMFFSLEKRISVKFVKEHSILRLFAIFNICAAPLGILSTLALHRVNYYLFPFGVVMFIYSVAVLRFKSRESESLLWLTPFLFYGAYMVSWLLTSRHARTCYIPYESYLFLS